MSTKRTLYRTQISQVINHTTKVRELLIETLEPRQFSFQAGQFVMLHIPQNEKPTLRAYSLASDERDKNGFRLLFKYVDQGLASEYIWQKNPGDELLFTGPFGKVFFKEPPTQQVIFLNTGTGVSQHMSYLLSKADFWPNVKFHMLFGVRSESDLYYQAELDQVQKKISNFTYEYVLSRPGPDWQGKTGYVQNFIDEFSYLSIPSTFYLCGNGDMIKQTKAKLEASGLDKSFVHSEAFD